MSDTRHDSTASEDGFCNECGVTLNLHNGPDSCDYAEARAEGLEQMERMMFSVWDGGDGR